MAILTAQYFFRLKIDRLTNKIFMVIFQKNTNIHTIQLA